MNKIVILLIGLFIVVACTDKEEPIGKWDDIIKLSKKTVQFSAKGDSVIIKTEGDWWWINSISLDEDYSDFYKYKDIDFESDSYIIEGTDYTVEKRDKNTLFISMSENSTGSEHVLVVTLEAGDYFDYVNVTQASE